ncbi:MAG: class I SAM-dependent methyltransferase [Gemmatimonadetes bacterium]|nr:class I SAM-dependent methyltransferase [Gemmatimonadota bacterium]
MGVAEHLRIRIDDYDQRIRTFVPGYEEMLRRTAETLRLLDATSPAVVDLGTGTGALARCCLDVAPRARIVGIDDDPAMLELARARLGGQGDVELVHGDFLLTPPPPADAIVACIALHHIPTPEAKRALYRRCAAVLRPGGVLASADYFPARLERLAALQRGAWLEHLERTYPRADAEAYLDAWAEEDTYFPLEDELAWLRDAGLRPEVVWRQDGFAVLAGIRPA